MKFKVRKIIVSLFSLSVCVFAQSRDNVTTVTIKAEKGRLMIIKDRSVIRRDVNYEVKKGENNNYVITYFGTTPKILYVNERPIYITPGDDVKLDYRYIRDPGKERDTLIATGLHFENYIYSQALMFKSPGRTKSMEGILIPKLSDSKYKSSAISFYDDLRKYHDAQWRYSKSYLLHQGYNSDIIRQSEQDDFVRELFSLRYYEDNFAKANKAQLEDFSKKLDLYFSSKNISPSDTALSLNIEGAIAMYFGHLAEIKFRKLETEQLLHEMVLFIKNYPNQFVREYLLFFLKEDYADTLQRYNFTGLGVELEKISNPVIKAALNEKTGNTRTPSGLPPDIEQALKEINKLN
ncbi:hypothetical protein [Pedobacter psychroterrae]|uniref:Uncharacterized protein n=1 Tax=Pedobacter psychroterrae TaxID=2530453 RepID=A0A4R0NH27_9SPHI|nr:hypothetical protein [Pedobacter psychroterrae]TCC99861.1 hypothetical protein EZ437_16595 [Pedobacter psychroterrae]